jgi:hypothetical protein
MTAPICFYLKDGIFAGGAVLTLAATALGLTSFILLRMQAANAAVPAVHATGTMPHPAFNDYIVVGISLNTDAPSVGISLYRRTTPVAITGVAIKLYRRINL